MKHPERTRRPGDPDLVFAGLLLFGIVQPDGERTFLSKNTSPTEKEARRALAKILLSGDVPTYLLYYLADLIDPDRRSFRRIEFKNLSQGHPKDLAHFMIANRVYGLRKKKEKNAIAKVAKEVGKDPRTVARIYSKNRGRCEECERNSEWLRKYDTSSRTDAMASDK